MPKGNLTTLIQIFGLTVLLGLAFFLDVYFAVSLFWQFNLTMAFLALLVLLPSFLARQKTNLWLLSLFGVALFGLNSITISPLKPFVQFHRAILPSMSAYQVSHLYEQYFPVGGPFRRPVWHWGNGSPVTPYDNMPQWPAPPINLCITPLTQPMAGSIQSG